MHMLSSDTNSKPLSREASVPGLCNISMENSVVRVYPVTFVFCTALADAGTRRPCNAEIRAVADLSLGNGTLLGSVRVLCPWVSLLN